ncbi:MAG TPA: hypothetical protein VGM39_19360 [Kofleriaceae bacterium]|jgi:hypothetical protein
MKRLLAIAALATLGASVAVAAPAVYAVGGTMEYGNAYLPSTADAGLSTFVSYHDWGGVVSAVLLLLATAPAKPSPHTSVRSEDHCSAGYCATYEVTTTTYPSSAEMANWEARMAVYNATTAPAIWAGEFGQDVQLDIASRSLGGNTSGFQLRLYRPLGDSRHLSIGMGYAYLSFHDVHTSHVVDNMGVLSATDKKDNYTYGYVGIPLRFSTAIGQTGFGLDMTLDLNVLSLFFDDNSPIRAGVHWGGSHVLLTAEAMASGLRPDGASLHLGALLAF